MNATNNSLNPYVYHVEKCGKKAFKKLEHTQIHAFWPGFEEHEENEDDYLVEEDEENEDLIDTKFYNGNNEVVKILSQKCYLFRKIVFMHLDNVVISVFVSNVIKIKVTLIY